VFSQRNVDPSEGQSLRRRRSQRSATRSAGRAALLLSVALSIGAAGAFVPSATAGVASPAPRADRGATPIIYKDIDYKSASAEWCETGACLLDLYRTKGRPKRKPLVVVIHGGGWIHGPFSSKDLPRIKNPSKDIASAGYVVLTLDYPGASNEPYQPGTTMEEDAVNEAVAWASRRKIERKYGIDTSKVAFIGGSSGGQLSFLSAFNANEGKPGQVTMAYSLSGPVDLWEPMRALQSGDAHVGDPGYEEGIPGFRNIELYLGCDWDGDTAPVCEEAPAKAVSPLYIGDSTCPLVRITRSTSEDMGEAQALVDGLLARGCGTPEEPRAEAFLAGTEHGFAQWPLIGESVIADLDAHMKVG
jgi:acetyl esterase/lipase